MSNLTYEDKSTNIEYVNQMSLAEILSFTSNQKLINKIVSNGKRISVILEGTHPNPNAHGYHGLRKMFNIQDMCVNLLSKLSNVVATSTME